MKKYKKLQILAALVVIGTSYFLSGTQTAQATNPDFVIAAAKIDLKNGEKVYKQNCAVCHGNTGKADGPAGKALKPSPRDFSKGEFKYSKNDAELLAFIKKGKPPMPSWEKKLNDQQIQDVIAFIHSLKKK